MSLFKILKGDSSRISMDVTPFHEGWCYFTGDDGGFYIDSETNGVPMRTQINQGSISVTATLTKEGWSNKQQTLYIDEIKADQNGFAGISSGASDEQMEAAVNAQLRIAAYGDGTITIAAVNDAPACDIPIDIVLLN